MENITASKQAEMKRFSKRLFGNEHRLEVALTILELAETEPHRLYKQALADELGVTDREIEMQLRRFRALGMIERHPDPPASPEKRGPGAPPQVFRCSDDRFWNCLDELGNRFRSS
jgi:DNA-binding MarR family transcriptional regulator